jgi:hypothetical protein
VPFAAAQTVTCNSTSHTDTNAYGAIDLGYDPTPFLNIAVDPLDNDMSAYLAVGVVTSQMIANTPSYPGYLNYTIQYQFVSTVSDNGYVWQGTFTVEYYRQNVVSCGGRAHRLCSIYAANAGAGELSAIPQ